MALSPQHFFIKLVLAAPASSFPSLPTALLAQDWAKADPTAKDVIRAAKVIRFIVLSIIRTINIPLMGDFWKWPVSSDIAALANVGLRRKW
jgi:hypothetical protein